MAAQREREVQVYTVPGLGGSGPRHWQSLWEHAHPEYRRIEQDDWNEPRLEAWMAHIVAVVDASVAASAVPTRALFIAHSFGCLAVAHAAVRLRGRIAGALLVAPADPDRFGIGAQVRHALEFPAIMVASSNDPWLSHEQARPLAEAWGAALTDIGACGHVNAEAGFGPWKKGRSLLGELRRRIQIHDQNAMAA